MKSPFKFNPIPDAADITTAVGFTETEEAGNEFVDRLFEIQQDVEFAHVPAKLNHEDEQVIAGLFMGIGFARENTLPLVLLGRDPFKNVNHVTDSLIDASGYTTEEFESLRARVEQFCDDTPSVNPGIDCCAWVEACNDTKEAIFGLMMVPAYRALAMRHTMAGNEEE